MKKKFLHKILVVASVAVGLILLTVSLHVSIVNNQAEGLKLKVNSGMTFEQVLEKVGAPDDISEFPFSTSFSTDANDKLNRMTFIYYFPYIWDYLGWSRQKMYTSLGKAYIEKARYIEIDFSSDQMRVRKIWDNPHGEKTFWAAKPTDLEDFYKPTAENQESQDLNDVVYFPSRTLAEDLYDSVRIYIESTEHFRELKEPSIYKQRRDKDRNIFRLLWVTPQFASTMIKLEIRDDGTGLLDFKQLRRRIRENGTVSPYRSKVLLERTLSTDEVDEFLSSMEEQGFWQLDCNINNNEFEKSYCLIPYCLIEGLLDGEYKIVVFHPRPEGSSYEILSYFYKLLGADSSDIQKFLKIVLK